MWHRGVQEVEHPTSDIVKVSQDWLSQTSYPIHRRIKSQVSCWPSVRCSKGSPRSSQEFWRLSAFWFPCALERSANETLSLNKKKPLLQSRPVCSPTGWTRIFLRYFQGPSGEFQESSETIWLFRSCRYFLRKKNIRGRIFVPEILWNRLLCCAKRSNCCPQRRTGCAINSTRQGTLKDRVFHFKKMWDLRRIYRGKPPGCSCSSRWPCYLNIFNAAKTSTRIEKVISPGAADTPQGSVVSMPKWFQCVALEMDYGHTSAMENTYHRVKWPGWNC